MSRQYRAWRDYLVRCIEDVMPSNEPYHLLHTASMVGLFSCVFIKGSQRSQVRDVSAAEIKRGMGGLHGNKVSYYVSRWKLDLQAGYRGHWLCASFSMIHLYV